MLGLTQTLQTNYTAQVMLVAVHPWDVNGAKAAGLQAAFVARNGEPYPAFLKQPDLTIDSLTHLAEQLAKGDE